MTDPELRTKHAILMNLTPKVQILQTYRESSAYRAYRAQLRRHMLARTLAACLFVLACLILAASLGTFMATLASVSHVLSALSVLLVLSGLWSAHYLKTHH